MRIIKQRLADDCGVACVAMLAGVPYLTAKKAIFGDEAAGLTNTPEIKKATRPPWALAGIPAPPVEGARLPNAGRSCPPEGEPAGEWGMALGRLERDKAARPEAEAVLAFKVAPGVLSGHGIIAP